MQKVMILLAAGMLAACQQNAAPPRPTQYALSDAKERQKQGRDEGRSLAKCISSCRAAVNAKWAQCRAAFAVNGSPFAKASCDHERDEQLPECQYKCQ